MNIFTIASANTNRVSPWRHWTEVARRLAVWLKSPATHDGPGRSWSKPNIAVILLRNSDRRSSPTFVRITAARRASHSGSIMSEIVASGTIANILATLPFRFRAWRYSGFRTTLAVAVVTLGPVGQIDT